MNTFAVFLAFALAAVAVAEPPSGYNYNRPSSGGNQGGYSHGGGGGGGYPSGGSSGYVGSFSSAGSFSSGGGGSLQNVPVGGQTSEGLQVDQQLLNEIRQILLREESQSSSSSGGFGGSAPSGSYGPPSGSYGPPSGSYGVPHGGSSGGRVVGIDLEGVRQAIQVAQYLQTATSSVSGGGYPSGPSGSYGAPSAPSGSYGAPSRPSGSYGAPY